MFFVAMQKAGGTTRRPFFLCGHLSSPFFFTLLVSNFCLVAFSYSRLEYAKYRFGTEEKVRHLLNAADPAKKARVLKYSGCFCHSIRTAFNEKSPENDR